MNMRGIVVSAIALGFLGAFSLDVMGQGRPGPPPRMVRPLRSHTPAVGPRPWRWGGIYGPRASLPVWLRTSARSLRPLYAMSGPVRNVSLGGTTIVVSEPKPVVLPDVALTTSVAVPAEAKSPFVEFALIVEKRLRDLDALMDAAVQSQDGITEVEGPKFCKAYTCVYIAGYEVTPDLSDAGRHKAKISYASQVMVQVGDTKEAVTTTEGFPDEGSKPQTTTEDYVYRDGRWACAEPQK